MLIDIHLIAATWVLLAGGVQLALPKGTRRHRALGWSWMIAMLAVALSSFGIRVVLRWWWGFSPIHLLSLWVIFCVAVSVWSARHGNIERHKGFARGAYVGAIGAALFALAPGRLLHQMIFG